MSARLDHDVRTLDPEAVRALSELLDGDEEALSELTQAMLDEAPVRLDELRLAAEQGDAALAGRAAHTLKSNAQTFGASELASLCRALEAAARSSDLGGSGELIDRVEREGPRVQRALVALRAGARP